MVGKGLTDLRAAAECLSQLLPLKEEVATLSHQTNEFQELSTGWTEVTMENCHQTGALSTRKDENGSDSVQKKPSEFVSGMRDGYGMRGGRSGRGRSGRGRRGHEFGGRGRRGVGEMGGQSGQAATRVVSKQERSGGAGHGEGATEMGNGSLGMVKVGGKSGDGLSRLRTKRRVKVVGARKVWGTLYTTTSLAVRNVISNIAKNPTEQLVIKRKYKENPNSRKVSKWWFVIRGEENLLQQLQLKWQAVSAWKLQDVVAYADDSSLMTSEAPSTQDEPITSGVFESDDSVPHVASPREIPDNSSDFCSDNHISSQCPRVPRNSSILAPSKTDVTSSPQPCIVTGDNVVSPSTIEHCSSVSQMSDASHDNLNANNEKHISIDVDSDSTVRPFLDN